MRLIVNIVITKRFAEKKPMDVLKEELKRNYYDLGITGYNITADCFNDNRRFVMLGQIWLLV